MQLPLALFIAVIKTETSVFICQLASISYLTQFQLKDPSGISKLISSFKKEIHKCGLPQTRSIYSTYIRIKHRNIKLHPIKIRNILIIIPNCY